MGGVVLRSWVNLTITLVKKKSLKLHFTKFCGIYMVHKMHIFLSTAGLKALKDWDNRSRRHFSGP